MAAPFNWHWTQWIMEHRVPFLPSGPYVASPLPHSMSKPFRSFYVGKRWSFGRDEREMSHGGTRSGTFRILRHFTPGSWNESDSGNDKDENVETISLQENIRLCQSLIIREGIDSIDTHEWKRYRSVCSSSRCSISSVIKLQTIKAHNITWLSEYPIRISSRSVCDKWI